MTHYEALGAARTASANELRDAFRTAARAAHPDRHGDASSQRMAAVNEAWSVLGDPGRRRQYDAELDAAERRAGSARASSPTARPVAEAAPAPAVPTYHQPAKFPWRFMAVLASFGIALIVVGLIVYDPPTPVAPDGVLRPGDCVMLSTSLEATEVICGAHDAVVDRLIQSDGVCPAGTEPYRDHLGMGTACVVRSSP